METLGESIRYRKMQIELEGKLALSEQKLQECTADRDSLRKQVLDQKDELVKHFSDITHRDSTITRLQDQVRALRTEIHNVESKVTISNRSLEKILTSLESLLADQDGDYPELIRKLITEHFPNHTVNFDLAKETRHQVLAMSRKISGMINVSDQRDRRAKMELHKRTDENALLIEEVNSLRRENKSLQEEISSIETAHARDRLLFRTAKIAKPAAPQIPDDQVNRMEEEISMLKLENEKLRVQLFSAHSTLKNFKSKK